MLLLENPIQPYPWGPIDGLAAVLGTEPTGDHEAELWVGAHDRGPSVVVGGPDDGRRLGDVIGSDPGRWLGARLVSAGQRELPFLLKVLAIESPLSLQAHPSARQAAEGFAREEAEGLAIDDPTRTYRDRHPKPEALVALDETWALCGFRAPEDAARLVRQVEATALDPLVRLLGGTSCADSLRSSLAWILHLAEPGRGEVAHAVAAAAHRIAETDPDPAWRWAARIADQYPGDPGCLAPLLMQVLRLEPGDAVHLPAGNLHAYLHGAGVEIMAPSDNVLRGGLTEKHIDVDQLLDTLTWVSGVPDRPECSERGGLVAYDAGEEAFALARLDAPNGIDVDVEAPSLFLPVGGTSRVERGATSLRVDPGRAVYVSPGEPVRWTAPGSVWWATTGDGLRCR